MEHESGVLAHKTKAPKKPKPMKEFHAKALHDGSFHFAKHSGNPEPPEEGSAKDVEELKEEMGAHMGGAGAAPAEPGAGEPVEPPAPVVAQGAP